jgi:hypothetical protein
MVMVDDEAVEIRRLLSLTEDELNKRIRRDLLSIKHLGLLTSLATFAFFDEGTPQDGKTRPASPLERYKRLKEDLLRFPGRLIVPYLHYYAGGGEKIKAFCSFIKYCQINAAVRRMLKALKAEIGVAVGVAGAMVAETETVQRAVEYIKETKQLMEDITKKGIPMSLAVKSAVYLADDLCPCCKTCDGSGYQETGEDCPDCKGSGLAANFPYPFPR